MMRDFFMTEAFRRDAADALLPSIQAAKGQVMVNQISPILREHPGRVRASIVMIAPTLVPPDGNGVT
jgi:hypothetical protein